jgi:hypothetical protein
MCGEDALETVVARLIANTRKRARPHNLVQVARDIRLAEGKLGSLSAVSEVVGVSTDMLRQFLSVERLTPRVRMLVEQRAIDLINVIHYMSGFDAEAQEVIAHAVVDGRLSAEDVRALAPLRRRFPELPVGQLISRVEGSRDIRVYVAHFRVPDACIGPGALHKRFEEIVGADNVVSLMVKDQVATLKLTSSGRDELKAAARQRNVSLRKFVDLVARG